MITIISNSNTFSGNATRIINLAKHIKNSEILFTGPENKLKGINARFTHHNKILSITEKSIQILLRKSDVIHCFKTLPTSGVPSLFGRMKGTPLIIDWDDFEGFGGFADQDSFPFNYVAHYFEKWIIKRAKVLTVVSPFLEKKAKEYGFEGPIHFVPNGADTTGIKYTFPKQEDKIKLLFVGLLYKSSDLDFVLKSMKFLSNDFELIVVGDGPKRQEFETLAKTLKIKNINFVGMKSREEVKKYLYSTHIALMPYVDNISNRSRSPVKFGEYLAAGMPIVTNPVGIMETIIKDEKNGILTKDNPEHFAKGIKKLENIGLRKKISVNARETAEKYCWKNIAKKLEKIYEEFL